jgi:hypothetical protein
MLFFVIGLSGPFSEWCVAAAAQLAAKTLNPVELVRANTLDGIGRQLLRSRAPHAVVASDQPGGELRRALAAADHPFILALDDPRSALADLVTRQGLALAAATRIVAGSCASCLAFREAPGALVVAAERGAGDPLALATAIARHLRLDLDPDALAAVVGSLEAPPAGFAPGSWWANLDPAERSIAAGALGLYLDPPAAPGPQTLDWGPELFFTGDQASERLSGSIDITGRARCLLRGPQVMLPPGHWSLSVRLEFSPDAADHAFLIEIAAGAAPSRTVLRPTTAGVVEAQLSLTLADLPDQPIELRLANERPAFGGELTLLGITLTREPEPVPTAPAAPEC